MDKVNVKILGIAAAHRKGMNTAWLVQYALKAAEKVGRKLAEVAVIETELLDLAGKTIKPCRNCEMRHMPNKGMPYTGEPKYLGCPIKDDFMAEVLAPKMKEADAFVFGSPVYGLSYTSQFRLFTERVSPQMWQGAHRYKPAVAVTVGEMALAGQETCLSDINRMICGSEMICASWYLGVPGVSGPPFGPHPADRDYGTKIGVKKHRYSQWLAVMNGRRVAELAVMIKIAQKQLGDLYDREFIKVCHPPHGEEPWSWRRLDKADEEYMENLPRAFTISKTAEAVAAELDQDGE
ncbi:MAG: flavodoxin family protein [Chloroflexi bacterium]|nr:flavodoxin family protein [Chloroflexota bacterium]